MIGLLCVIAFTRLVIILLVYPRLPWWISLLENFVVDSCLTFMIVTSYQNPGYVKNGVHFSSLVSEIDTEHLCPDCETIKTSRSQHCLVCHQCVERFDHHCPWVNNCIGVKNHNTYMAYLVFQLLAILMDLVMCIWATITVVHNEYYLEPYYRDWKWLVKIQEPTIVFALVVLVGLMNGAVLVPFAKLIRTQVNNFSAGRTTKERFGRNACSSGFDIDEFNVKRCHNGIEGDDRMFASITSGDFNSLIRAEKKINKKVLSDIELSENLLDTK